MTELIGLLQHNCEALDTYTEATQKGGRKETVNLRAPARFDRHTCLNLSQWSREFGTG